jgi:uncharacterized protein (DUF4415 family)
MVVYGQYYPYLEKLMKRKGKATRRKVTGRGKMGKLRTLSLRASAEEGGGSSSKRRDWQAELGTLYRPIKRPVTLRLDGDVLAWFKRRGKGYQTRINRALRQVMKGERKTGE